MTPQNIADKTRKIIETDQKAVIEDVYFNPLYASKLKTKVPELKEAKLFITVTETESENGTIKEVSIQSKQSGAKLDLGSMRLDGFNKHISKPLVTVDRLVEFIKDEAIDIPEKTVDEKEDIREAKLEEEMQEVPTKRRFTMF